MWDIVHQAMIEALRVIYTGLIHAMALMTALRTIKQSIILCTYHSMKYAAILRTSDLLKVLGRYGIL